jgi:hypothetical protein
MSGTLTLAELEALSRDRLLSGRESDDLYAAWRAEDNRQRRLPERIMRLRAALHAAEAALWPRYLPKLAALEAIEAERLIGRLEREIGQSNDGGAA